MFQHKDHEFNQLIYSIKEYEENQIRSYHNISSQNYQKFLVHPTALGEEHILYGSNSLHLLVQMKVDLREESFRNEFEWSEITHSKWRNLKINELNKLMVIVIFDQVVGYEQRKQKNYNKTKEHGQKYSVKNFWIYGILKQENKYQQQQCLYLFIMFLSDNKILAFGSNDSSICLQDVSKKQQRFQLKGHYVTVYSAYFSTDGTTLASGGDQFYSFIRYIVRIQKHQVKWLNQINQFMLFFSDNTILACSSFGSFQSLGFENRIIISQLDGQTNHVQSVSFLMALHQHLVVMIALLVYKEKLWSFSCDYSISQQDVKTGQQKAKFDGREDAVYSVNFSSSRNKLASGGYDTSISLCEDKRIESEIKWSCQLCLVSLFLSCWYLISTQEL
ncbi:unnamed protein product [Paramecium octaurelia]|uniref:Uncharacterized protein n=1 Tax=Paramecium octaurelia TaxID=43137 RepID=A0A8S1YQ40_PAROT|nr:unnamed protein product [Paramecium octaurelia]